MTQRIIAALCFALLVALLDACSYSRLEHGTARAVNVRWFWMSEGFKFTAAPNGAVTIELQKSDANTDALKAVAQGAAQGAVRGLTP